LQERFKYQRPSRSPNSKDAALSVGLAAMGKPRPGCAAHLISGDAARPIAEFAYVAKRRFWRIVLKNSFSPMIEKS
jgi:hypothetical protein